VDKLKQCTPTVMKGATLIEKYKVLNFIAEGSNATVWCAQKLNENTKVAIKHITFYDSGSELMKRTCREIKLLKFLSDYDQVINLSEVIAVMDSSNTIVEVFLVLELMEVDLAFYIKNNQALSLDVVRNITSQILTGLYIIHKQDIIHRDIKPQNILLTLKPQLQVKLGDFGTGRFVTSGKKFNISSLLEVSTIYYCAPEGLLNPNSYGTSVDIWALGCIVYELLTKKPLVSIQNLEIIKNFEWGLLKKMIFICGKPKELDGIPDSKIKTLVLNHPELETPSVLENFLTTLNNPQVSSLLNGLLSFDVKKRLNAESAFKEPFISESPPSQLLSKTKDMTFKEPLNNPDAHWTKYLTEEISQYIS